MGRPPVPYTMRFFVLLLLSFTFTAPIWSQSTYSIRGVAVPAAELGKAYEKAVDRYVFGEGLRKPVTEKEYVQAWEDYRKEQARREEEKRDRDQAMRQQYRNGQNNYNRNTYNRRSATTTVKAGTGISVRDKKEPEFITVKGVVVKPGRRDAMIQDEDGALYIVSGGITLTKTGRVQTFKLKEDPEGRSQSMRTQAGVKDVKLYENFTLTPQEFVKQLRGGEMLSMLPALKRDSSVRSAPTNVRSTPERKGTSFGGNSFGSSGSLGSGGSSRGSTSSSLGQRTEGSGFSRRTTTIKR